jgi:integrase
MRPIKFDRFIEETLCLFGPPMRSKGTRRQISQALREFAKVKGVKRTSDLRPRNVGAWLTAHPDRTPVRAASLLRALSSACRYAVAEGYLRVSPFAFRRVNDWVADQPLAPDKPRPPKHQPAEAIAALLAHLDDDASKGGWKAARLQALVYLLAYTGLRKMEALTLKVSDINLERRLVSVRPRRSHSLKTRASAATLPLADPLVEVLRRWLPRCGGEWVFPGARLGGPWTGGPPGQKPIDAVRKAGDCVGIHGLTILGFRKTLGTLAKQWGLGQLEVRALLRHSKVETQRWYDEEQVESLRPAVSRIQFRITGAQA